MRPKFFLLLLALFLLYSCSLSVNPHKRSDIVYFQKKNPLPFSFSNEFFSMNFDFIFDLQKNFNIFDADMRGVGALPLFLSIEKKKDVEFTFKKSFIKDENGKKYRVLPLKVLWKRIRKFYKIKFYNKHMEEEFFNSFGNLMLKDDSGNRELKGFLLFDVPENITMSNISGSKLFICGRCNKKKVRWEISIEKR